MLPVGGIFERRGIGETVNDIPACRPKSIGHGLDMRNINRVPIILQVIDSPFSPLLRILFVERIGAEFPVRLPLGHNLGAFLALVPCRLILGSTSHLVEGCSRVSYPVVFVVIA